jgi:hypothetical protein
MRSHRRQRSQKQRAQEPQQLLRSFMLASAGQLPPAPAAPRRRPRSASPPAAPRRPGPRSLSSASTPASAPAPASARGPRRPGPRPSRSPSAPASPAGSPAAPPPRRPGPRGPRRSRMSLIEHSCAPSTQALIASRVASSICVVPPLIKMPVASKHSNRSSKH